MNRNGSSDRNNNVQVDEKGKEKVEDIEIKMNNRWVKKSDNDARNGSTPDFSAGNLSRN